ncbi:hypothetical protein [Chelatococcus sp. XZ-Ab1]|uniref:hypothetical protein n=1 Tax=Chelatococcus sp. XZ-Ab1 TaxID=3034027 RepID=UPI0023E3D83D|nr:hypothetical protein [Chelatococcus sp. XZ-Ab1]
MHFYQCAACETFERLRYVPDACSVCGGAMYRADEPDTVEQDEGYAAEAAEVGFADDPPPAAPVGERAAIWWLALGAGAALIISSGVDDGLERCLERYSTATCVHSLYR